MRVNGTHCSPNPSHGLHQDRQALCTWPTPLVALPLMRRTACSLHTCCLSSSTACPQTAACLWHLTLQRCCCVNRHGIRHVNRHGIDHGLGLPRHETCLTWGPCLPCHHRDLHVPAHQSLVCTVHGRSGVSTIAACSSQLQPRKALRSFRCVYMVVLHTCRCASGCAACSWVRSTKVVQGPWYNRYKLYYMCRRGRPARSATVTRASPRYK